MLSNPLLDAIEQGRLRNQQDRLAQQQRLMGIPQSVAPIVNPILDNLAGGTDISAPDPFSQPSVSPQQAYNQAVAFNNVGYGGVPAATGALQMATGMLNPVTAPVMAIGGMMADVARKGAVGKEGVTQLSAKPYGVFGKAMGWSDAPAANSPYQSNAWNALRDTFKASSQNEAATDENMSAESAKDAAQNNGWGGSLENFGATLSDFSETYGGAYSDGGGDFGGEGWGGAGESAFGGDVGDFSGFA